MHKCKYCDKEYETGVKLGGHTTTCVNNPNRRKNIQLMSDGCRKRKMNENVKQKISNSLIKAHFDKRHPGWYHINSNKTMRSRPEEYFYNALIKDNTLHFIEKYYVDGYFLDFALLKYKCDIEIDGKQHFNKNQIEHDKKRNEYLIQKGWRIFRIPAKLILINCELQIQKLKYWLETDEKLSTYDFEKVLKLYSRINEK